MLVQRICSDDCIFCSTDNVLVDQKGILDLLYGAFRV